MPLLLSPSLSSSVDRPPTYLSDGASTPSTTPSLTPSIKCEPIEHNCGPQHNSHTLNDNSLDKSDSIDRHSDKLHRSVERQTKKHNINNNSKQSFKESIDSEAKQESHQRITTTITTSTPTKHKEKNSVRVEPLVRNDRNDTTNEMTTLNGTDVAYDLTDKRNDNNHNKHKSCKNTIEKLVDLTQNSEESRDKTALKDNNKDKDNKAVKSVKSVNPRVKRELIECDMSLPSNQLKSVKSVPNCDDVNSDSNTNDVIANNVNTESSPKHKPIANKSKHLNDTIDEINQKNLSIDDSSNSNTSDVRQLTIVCNSLDMNGDSASPSPNQVSSETKRAKDLKRESQLKQLQSYRKESHRRNANKPSVNGIESGAAISIVLPKPNDQINGEHKKPLSGKLVNQSLSSSSAISPTIASSPETGVEPTQAVPVSTESKAQSKTAVVTCCTKPVPEVANSDAIDSNVNPLLQNKSMNLDKPVNNGPNATNGPKLSHNANKQLPKKPRISRKAPSSGIPVGIAIAQQRTSPKTKSPNDSNASQPLKPILPTLSLPMMANSPILITDSPPAGTSLWIKPTNNSTMTNNSPIQSNSQFSLSGDYQLARDSLTGICSSLLISINEI